MAKYGRSERLRAKTVKCDRGPGNRWTCRITATRRGGGKLTFSGGGDGVNAAYKSALRHMRTKRLPLP